MDKLRTYVYYADIQHSLMFMYLHNHGLLQQSSVTLDIQTYLFTSIQSNVSRV